MTETEYEKLRERFRLTAGTIIAGKIFAEYCFYLKELYNHKVKGDTTKFNRCIEAEARATKLVNVISEDLKAVGIDLGIAEDEGDNVGEIIYAHLQLNEVNQKRVKNLIAKLKYEEEQKEIVAAAKVA